MRKLSPAICAVALVAAACVAATPAAAQPPRVIVRGATPILPPAPYVFNGNPSYGWYDPSGIYEDPFSRYYDPAGKIPDDRYYGPKAVDLILARTLDRNNESIMGHMLRCQAHYPTYNPATDRYYGAHGIPVPCYL
jgi:hypothetical protein